MLHPIHSSLTRHDVYRRANNGHWDERASAHAASEDYQVERFHADPEFLSGVVSFDRHRLGNLHGQHGLHLQCHIGTDTVSLARLGARMTGVDFSAASLRQARLLANTTGADATFVQSDVYDTVATLGRRRFDFVYTGVGALCWLPELSDWAGVVARLLRRGGRLLLREAHPMLWALDDSRTDGLFVEKPYFNTVEPRTRVDNGTYVATEAVFADTAHYTWNHGLGEILTALLDQDLRIAALEEHDTVPWCALPGQMHQSGNGEWQLTDRPERLPHSYTIEAVKN